MPPTKLNRKWMTALTVVMAGLSLTACASDKDSFRTFMGATGNGSGVCSALPVAKYAVKGATSYDQRWADETTETEIAGCNRDRPLPRPASLNQAPALKQPVKNQAATSFKQRWLSAHFRRRVQ